MFPFRFDRRADLPWRPVLKPLSVNNFDRGYREYVTGQKQMTAFRTRLESDTGPVVHTGVE